MLELSSLDLAEIADALADQTGCEHREAGDAGQRLIVARGLADIRGEG